VEGLAPIDGWAVAAILAKAVGYCAALIAMGGPLFIVTFRTAPRDVLALVGKLATLTALIVLAVLALRFGIRAARISGMGLAGATDRMMLGFVWDSPLGNAALLRAAGAALIPAVLIKSPFGLVTSVAGALLVAVSYTLIGHSMGDPRWLLATLLTVHLLAAAFWVGALAPLYRATQHAHGAKLLHRFGSIATGTVAVLILVGLVFAALMVGSISGLVGTAYGWVLMIKVLAVAGLMGLAAKNKLQFVPALASGDETAIFRLRRTIRLEMVAVGAILLVTATLTSVTTPPVNL
jgi:putative copper resistance protein D